MPLAKRFYSDPQAILDATSLVSRFIDYVKINTMSDEHQDTSPSTDNQLVLAKKLTKELRSLGLDDAQVDANCYVTATLQGNCETRQTVGLLAHLDTSPSAPSENVNPVLHENYDGGPIRLKNGVVIAQDDNPCLSRCIGDTIITSDGTTLLGADDKAGIAEIMSVIEYYKLHPDTPHPTIRIGFTPDEEIGRGTQFFSLEIFGADVAFTLDGTFDGEINLETFHANSAFITITGISTHPGTAKGRLVNALRFMSKFIERLPAEWRPESTEEREGFIHPYELNGTATSCKCHLIVRDFDKKKLHALGSTIKAVAASLIKEEPRLSIDIDIIPSYPNMYQYLKKHPEIEDRLSEAVRRAGVEPTIRPIRGGTDGSNLTRMGLPCPNLFSGGMNFHGQNEWISTRSMGLAVCAVLNLMLLYADTQ
ncbi:MAG: peptidase T [Proteobacteria bacterium]|nr:peptidase T [Pseudomonadota bacterium]